MQEMSVLVEAGFPKNDFFDEESIPRCSQRFKWPAIARVLYFTNDLELAYLYGPTIQQNFKATSLFEHDHKGTRCPWDMGSHEAKNPYYDPSRIEMPDQGKELKTTLEGSSENNNGGNENGFSQPTINAVDSAISTYKLDISSISNSVNPIVNSLSPIDVTSTFNTNPKTVGSMGGDCTGDGCDVASSMQQDDPSISKRGTPVEFHA
ncbi:hypothetical protein MMC22_010047 [Lobaria immixta]|nr:hypothetical protein [Lobaria immixta]